jgi:LysR family transcriptional regulator, glycine cleavage system transcriptional activator
METLPPLGALQTIEALSRHLRVGAAAAELGLSHSAVSQTVTRMEKRLGVRLFVKNSFGVEPTSTCRTLVEAYRSVSLTLRRALVAASDDARFHVLAPLLVWTWFAPAIARLHQVCPNLSFRGYRADEPVELDSADFAVLALGALPPADFDGTLLYEERLIPVCTPEYARLARLETPAALARAQLLISGRDPWLAWFAQAGLTNPPQLKGPVVADPSLAMQAALRGQGIALCCTVAASAAIARGELVAPFELSASAQRQIWAIWRKASDHAPAMRVLDGLLSTLDASQSVHCRSTISASAAA